MSQRKKFTSQILREKTGVKASPQLLELRKYQLDMSSKLSNALKAGPKTIPELSKETGIPSKTVLWYMMTYNKYNIIYAVGKTKEGYYQYALKPK